MRYRGGPTYYYYCCSSHPLAPCSLALLVGVVVVGRTASRSKISWLVVLLIFVTSTHGKLHSNSSSSSSSSNSTAAAAQTAACSSYN